MRDLILEKCHSLTTPAEKLNILREYLQCLVLKGVEERGYIKQIAFVGGTALRMLYDLKRFSEDLNFSLVELQNFDHQKFGEDIGRLFESWNIGVEVKPREVRTVKGFLLKFPNLMYEIGVTHRKEQKLILKLEVDCRPPAGAVTEVSFNRKFFPLNVFHYDRSSLFAGKLHAVLFRGYTKERDFYDLLWFLGEKVEPNLKLLTNAVAQSTGKREVIHKDWLKEKLLKRLSQVDFKKVQADLSRFLVDKNEAGYVTEENLRQLIGKL